MGLENKRLQFLVKSWIDNEITKEQLEELYDVLKISENETIVFSEMTKLWNSLETHNSNDLDSEEIYATITSDPRVLRSRAENDVIKLPRKRFVLLSYAATIFVICSIGLGVYLSRSHRQDSGVDNLAVNNSLNVKSANSNKAILTLSDGRQIILDQASKGKLAEDHQAVITKKEDGQIVYDLSAWNDNNGTKDLVYNTITTPNGGTYQILLPDGTKVWLNAMSSLKFPAVFSKIDRSVELTGEAYFEVTKSTVKPFIVAARGAKVEVLGTHFNVTAYPDESAIKTSLLEGKVKINNNSSSVILKPGQQSTMRNLFSPIEVDDVATDDVIAWKNGYFIFRNEPIQNIMNKISRWYDIDVKYEGDMTGKKFGGKYLKKNTLQELLKSLELTGTVHFSIDGRRVTVMQ